MALTGSEDKAFQILANYTANAKAGISVPLGKLVGLNAGAGVGEDSGVKDTNSSQNQESYQKFQDSMKNIGVDNILNETRDWANSNNEGHTDGTSAGTSKSLSASMDTIDSETAQASNAHSRELKLGEMESQVNRSSREITENSSWAVNKAAQEMGMDGQTLNRVIMDNNNPVKAQIYQRAEQLAAGNYIEQHLNENPGDSEKFGNLKNSLNGDSTAPPKKPDNQSGSSPAINKSNGDSVVNADASANGSDYKTVKMNVNAGKGHTQKDADENINKTKEKISGHSEDLQGEYNVKNTKVDDGIAKTGGKTTDISGTPVVMGLEAYRNGEQWASRHGKEALSVTPEQREKAYEAKATQVDNARIQEGIKTVPPGNLGEKAEELNHASEARKKEMEELKK
jgi:hypothetical protein